MICAVPDWRDDLSCSPSVAYDEPMSQEMDSHGRTSIQRRAVGIVITKEISRWGIV